MPLLQLLQGAGKARRQLLRPAPTHLPCQAEYLTVARAIYLRRVLASIPGRRVMLCDRARVIAGSDDQRRCPDASSLRPCRATRTFGLGRRFYGMSDTAVAAKKTVEVGKILIWSLTQFGCSPRWNGRLLSQRPATNVLRASLAPPQAAPAFNMYVRNGNCRSHSFPPSHRLRLLRHALLQILACHFLPFLP